MAVDETRRRDDRYEVALRDHDERVEVAGWVYYVRGVRDEKELLPRLSPVGELLVDAPVLAVRGIKRLAGWRRGWTVGVVRLASPSTWNNSRPAVVHQETLTKDEGPRERISQLVVQAEDGRFAPS